MPTTRYAVIQSLGGYEYGHPKTLKIFSTKEAAERYMGNILVNSFYEKLEKGEVITSSWDYNWTEKSKRLFFQHLKTRNIFPKARKGFNEYDVMGVKMLMIDMIKWKELDSDRFIYQDNVEEWFKLDEYFVKPLKHY